MISDSQKKEVVEKIIKSKQFLNAKTCSYLLQYLLKYNLENEIPKESVIAVEFFARKSTFNPVKESTVRIYMYRLRKQLEKYYKEEGLKDDVVVDIPKGHYELQFHEVNQNNDFSALRFKELIEKYSKKEKKYIVLTSFLSLLVVVLFILWPRSPKVENPISKSDPIWKSFFNNNYPINLVIGDLYIFSEKDKKYNRFRRIMNATITSDKQFLEYKANNPERELNTITLGELPHNSIFNLKDIMHVFNSFNKDFEIKFTKYFKYEDLKNNNIIYIGSFSRLQILDDLIKIIPLHYETRNRQLSVYSARSDTLLTFNTKALHREISYNLDYAFFAKLPGLNGENYIFLTGFGYIAQVDIVRKLSKRKTIEKFENQIKQYTPNFPKYFYAVFSVSGYGNSEFSSDLVAYNEIKTEKYIASFKQLLTKELE